MQIVILQKKKKKISRTWTCCKTYKIDKNSTGVCILRLKGGFFFLAKQIPILSNVYIFKEKDLFKKCIKKFVWWQKKKLLVVPRTQFVLWNVLPLSVRSVRTLNEFKALNFLHWLLTPAQSVGQSTIFCLFCLFYCCCQLLLLLFYSIIIILFLIYLCSTQTVL